VRVANAGIVTYGSVQQVDRCALKTLFDVNVVGVAANQLSALDRPG